MNKYPFSSVAELKDLLSGYFETNSVDIANNLTDSPKKKKNEPEPLTMSGLAYHLGFKSLGDFEASEAKGKYSGLLKRARLRVETEYEKKLHNQSASGAIFALKSLGWCDKQTKSQTEERPSGSMTVEIVHSGAEVSQNEKDVVL